MCLSIVLWSVASHTFAEKFLFSLHFLIIWINHAFFIAFCSTFHWLMTSLSCIGTGTSCLPRQRFFSDSISFITPIADRSSWLWVSNTLVCQYLCSSLFSLCMTENFKCCHTVSVVKTISKFCYVSKFSIAMANWLEKITIFWEPP